ncbi:MAG TPA: stress response translation initiation inhibitor YciH [Pseudomonadales bacterium]
MKSSRTGVVYSTDNGRMCPDCGKAKADCACRPPVAQAGTGPVYLSCETKGRKGAGVTLISGVPLAGDALTALAKSLKQRCCVGGAVKDGIIELQGDQRDKIEQALKPHGWVIKRKGG